MKSVTSFLNRLLAMAMEDQEVIFKYACCLHPRTTMLILALRYPSLFCAAPRADDMLARMQPAAGYVRDGAKLCACHRSMHALPGFRHVCLKQV